MNKAVVAGGSGFLGRAVIDEFAANGYEVVVLSRSGKPVKGARVRTWGAKLLGEWAEELEGAAAVVNLSGSPVMVRWTEQNKRTLLESREQSGRALNEAVEQSKNPPKAWISASGIGYYGDTGDRIVDESHKKGQDFLSDVCEHWESPLRELERAETRTAILRIGFVLGRGGGSLDLLAKLARWFLGGHIGSGDQWMSWIHIEDVARMFRWAAETGVGGAINCVSPEPVKNMAFMKAVRRALKRPWSPPVPPFVIHAIAKLSGMPLQLALESNRIVPKGALGSGFEFRYPELETALRQLLSGPATPLPLMPAP